MDPLFLPSDFTEISPPIWSTSCFTIDSPIPVISIAIEPKTKADQDRLNENLEKLEKILLENQPAIADAINADFGNRSPQETLLLEVYGLLGGIGHNRKRLKKVKWGLTVFFLGLGLASFAAYVKIGIEKDVPAGTRYGHEKVEGATPGENR